MTLTFLRSLLLFFIVTVSNADIIIDDFNAPTKQNWTGSSTYQMSIVDGALQIVSTKTLWRVFQKNIPSTDLSQHKVVQLKVKIPTGTTAPVIRLDLEDINGFITNKFNNIVIPIEDGEYHTYTFDYNNRFHQLYSGAGTIVPEKVDSAHIIKFTFHFNPGTSYNGTVFFDDLIIPGAQDNKLVKMGDVWKYAKADSVLSTTWYESVYPTNTWIEDTASFGFGFMNIKTELPIGSDPNNVPSVWYFKKDIEITSLDRMKSIVIEGVVDQGLVLYLNGVELIRHQMPLGTINNSTLANSELNPSNQSPFYYVVPTTLLTVGINTLSASLHMSALDDADATFDIKLSTTYYDLGVVRGPYLQSGTQNAISIHWRTLQRTDARIRYGTSLNNLDLMVDSLTVSTNHVVQLTNLLPNTTYYYEIGTTDGSVLKEAVLTRYFKTAPDVLDQSSTIWVTGDAGRITQYQRNMRDAYYNYIQNNHTDAWLLLGDNAYNDGTDAEYQYAMFENMFESKLENTVLWPSPGNHDLDKYSAATKDAPYFSIFNVPSKGEAGGVASGTESYYSFNYGNIHFISLDSYDTPRDSMQTMGQWLKADLATNTLPWVIAFWHHPPYSKGSHDSDDINDSKENNPSGRSRLFEMREQIVPLLERYGVDLILTGHSHSYERSYMINGHYGTSAEFNEEAFIMNGKRSGKKSQNQAYQKNPTDTQYPNIGTVYAVVGASGETSPTTTSFGKYDVFYFSSIAQTGSMVLHVEKDTLTAKYIYADGTIADEFSMVKDPTVQMKKVLAVADRVKTDPSVLSVSPNPIGVVLNGHVTLTSSQTCTVQVMKLQGVEVARILTDVKLPQGKNTFSINTDNLPVGMYIVRAVIGSTIYQTKVIKN